MAQTFEKKWKIISRRKNSKIVEPKAKINQSIDYQALSLFFAFQHVTRLVRAEFHDGS